MSRHTHTSAHGARWKESAHLSTYHRARTCECVSGPARRLGQLATHVVCSAGRGWGLPAARCRETPIRSDPPHGHWARTRRFCSLKEPDRDRPDRAFDRRCYQPAKLRGRRMRSLQAGTPYPVRRAFITTTGQRAKPRGLSQPPLPQQLALCFLMRLLPGHRFRVRHQGRCLQRHQGRCLQRHQDRCLQRHQDRCLQRHQGRCREMGSKGSKGRCRRVHCQPRRLAGRRGSLRRRASCGSSSAARTCPTRASAKRGAAAHLRTVRRSWHPRSTGSR